MSLKRGKYRSKHPHVQIGFCFQILKIKTFYVHNIILNSYQPCKISRVICMTFPFSQHPWSVIWKAKYSIQITLRLYHPFHPWYFIYHFDWSSLFSKRTGRYLFITVYRCLIKVKANQCQWRYVLISLDIFCVSSLSKSAPTRSVVLYINMYTLAYFLGGSKLLQWKTKYAPTFKNYIKLDFQLKLMNIFLTNQVGRRMDKFRNYVYWTV